MYFSRRTKFMLICLMIVLNVVLRFQVVLNEIGWDSFYVHIMANSLSEFGYARWFLHPLSIPGLYPVSDVSAVPFLLSGISQATGLEMRWVIFLYCIFIGILSMFTAYLMAGEIIDNDLFKFLVAFGFSTSPAVVGYTTLTIASRNFFIVLAPLFIYLLLKCRKSIGSKYVLLAIFLAIFLFTTHHLFYFLIPAFFAFFVLSIGYTLKKHINIRIPEKIVSFFPAGVLSPFISIAGFLCMFSIPFFTGRFIEVSRYAPIDESYVRYVGILFIPAIGGLAYLVFKRNKAFGEWFLLLTLIFLTTFIYEQTYMKWFLPIFLVPFAGIGLINVLRLSVKRKHILPIIAIFLLLVLSFSAYYQFLHTYRTSPYNERYIEESTYKTGQWMKENIKNGSAISNDVLFGKRIFAISETVHLLDANTVLNYIYGFIDVNLSQFERYPLTEEDFWFTGYKGPDIGEIAWESVHRMWRSPQELNISYVVENKQCGGKLCYKHGNYPQFLHYTYENADSIYDCGNINIWYLDLDRKQ